MSDFGGKLRQARERRGVSLRQIAASTKISVAALEALERNDISKLPGGMFSRAFVRSYAAEVGLNPDDTVREFLERFQAESPRAAAVPVRLPAEESAFESQQRMASVLLKLILISIPIVAIILYFTLRQPAEQSGRRRDPAVAATSAQGTASAPAAASAAGGFTLELRPTGPCWISLTVDGERVLQRLMHAGEREVHAVREAAVLVVGDPGALAFSIDGRPGRQIGESGQPKTIQITKDTVNDYIR